jgi:hypothetical protein
VSAEDLFLFCALDRLQKELGIVGHVCEIGVYRGKRFIPLYLCRRPNEVALAIDPFDDPEGAAAAEAEFRQNLDLHAGGANAMRLLRKDSATVTAAELAALAGGQFRLFSVDGAHTAPAVASDLRLAAATLVDGGVVIVDDYYNDVWPGVAEATLNHLTATIAEPGRLVPFGIFSTKVFLSSPRLSARYRELFAGMAPRYRVTEARLLGSDVVTLRLPPPVTFRQRLAQTGLWRVVRRTIGERVS